MFFDSRHTAVFRAFILLCLIALAASCLVVPALCGPVAARFAPSAAPSAQKVVSPAGFEGPWNSTFGKMELIQEPVPAEKGTFNVRGYYVSEGVPCSIQGKARGLRWDFTYSEADAEGEGWFEMAADGESMKGKWRELEAANWQIWEAWRNLPADPDELDFSGYWDTTYGKMRLTQKGSRVEGIYNCGGLATIGGTVEGNSLLFTYTDSNGPGSGRFDLSADRGSFLGSWSDSDSESGGKWAGVRHEKVPGRYWLVVLEARWEENLEEREYSYGNMLRSYFSMYPNVMVRHRFFDNEESLKKWCNEVAFLAEPVLLSIATHGIQEGLQVGSRTIGAEAVAQCLEHAENVILIHFSSCLIMKGDFVRDLTALLREKAAYPISGYATSVDWAMSAVIEFLYFDFILAKGYEPSLAADEIKRLLPFAGKENLPGAPFESADFRFMPPTTGHVAGSNEASPHDE